MSVCLSVAGTMGNLARGLVSIFVVLLSVIVALVLFSADNVDAYRRGGSRYYRSYRTYYYSRYYYYSYYGYSYGGSSSSSGVIAGAVVGGIVAVIVIVVVILIIRQKYMRKSSTPSKKPPAVKVTLNTPSSVIQKRQEFHDRKGPEYFAQSGGYNPYAPPPPAYGSGPPGAFQYQPAYPPPSDPAYPPGYVPR